MKKKYCKISKKTIFKIIAAELAAIVLIVASAFVLIKEPGEIKQADIKTDYNTITITWNKAENAKGYDVYCKKNAKGEYQLYTHTEKTTYTSKNVRTGKKYWYKIIPRNRFKKGQPYKCTVATSLNQPQISVKTGNDNIKVSATVVPGATGYEFYRNDKLIKRQKSTEIKDKKVEADKNYTYSVRAYRYEEGSVYSEMSSGNAKIISIGDLTASMDKNTGIIKLTWETKKPYTEYDVYQDDKKIETTEEGEYTISDIDEEEHEYKIVGKSDELTSPAITKKLRRTRREGTNKEAIQGALDWGAKIAADDSYSYGPGSPGNWHGTPKCPICGTIKEKRWTCMPFVGACYAHGAKDNEIMGKGSHMIYTTDRNFTRYSCWKKVGLCKDLTIDDLEPGDVIIWWSSSQGGNRNGDPGHACIYYGNDKILESTSGASKAEQIRVTSGGAAKRLHRYGTDNSKDPVSGKPKKELSYVMRYVGQGGGTFYELEELE